MIAVVIPTIRPEKFNKFLRAWQPLLEKHGCALVTVWDGENPTVNGKSANEIMGEYTSVLSNFNAGIRNLGFAYVAKELKDCEIIITLDDDVTPIGDPIQDHIDALQQYVPISWLSTGEKYTRGFPYSIRSEAEVVVSHGVWEGSGDWDAPTQLVLGENRPNRFYKGAIPKGIYYPMCSMNLAFKRKALPYMYHAPWDLGINRFDDIFAGITSKRALDKLGLAVVTGYAAVNHERASNVFKNLINEAPGIELNESFWKGDETHPYFKEYAKKQKLWEEFISKAGGAPVTGTDATTPFVPTEIQQNIIGPGAEQVTQEQIKTTPTTETPKEIVELSKEEGVVQSLPASNLLEENAMPSDSQTQAPLPHTENTVREEDKVEVQAELHFWRLWLEGNGRAYLAPRRLLGRFNFMLEGKQEVVIANLGSGPMNLIGDVKRGVNIKIVSSDLLADEYEAMKKELGILSKNPIEKQNMAKLTYADNTFDIVYCANALDHSEDPYSALLEMVRVCKPGGYIYLRHIAHEGKRHLYRNLHMWNIDQTENGDCRFWSGMPKFKGKEFLLSSIIQGAVTTTRDLPKAQLVTTYVQKT